MKIYGKQNQNLKTDFENRIQLIHLLVYKYASNTRQKNENQNENKSQNTKLTPGLLSLTFS